MDSKFAIHAILARLDCGEIQKKFVKTYDRNFTCSYYKLVQLVPIANLYNLFLL